MIPIYLHWKNHTELYIAIKNFVREQTKKKNILIINRLPNYLTILTNNPITLAISTRLTFRFPIQDNYLNSPRNFPPLLSFLSIPRHERLASIAPSMPRHCFSPTSSVTREKSEWIPGRVYPQQHPLPAEAAIRSR